MTLQYTSELLTKFEKIKKPTPLPPQNLILTNIFYEGIKFQEEQSIKLKIIQLLHLDIYQAQTIENTLNHFINELD